MPFTPTYQNVKPVVGGSADTWGATNNDRIGEAYADFTAAASVINATETLALAALPKAGGTLTGDVAIANTGPTDARSIGLRGVPIRSVSTNTTLVLNDAGGGVRRAGTADLTITIPPQGSVGFPIGTAIVLRNYSSGVWTVARGSGVELRTALSTTNKNFTIAPLGMATIYLEDSNMWVISGQGVA